MNRDHPPIGSTVVAHVAASLRDPEVREEYERVASSEALARIVIARRGELGLTQAGLAQRMGTTASVISRVESGQHAIGARTLKRLARALEARAVVGFEFGSVAAPERQLVVL
jgi:ribosome-binding protein aMBF1 (putative translation factor)